MVNNSSSTNALRLAVSQSSALLRMLLSTLLQTLLPILLIGYFLPCHAQENITLEAVTVTAAPAAIPTIESLATARKQIAAIAGGANIVDAQQYKEGRVSTLPDALQFSPGVLVASRFGSEEARLSIRGSGLQRTFHMRGIELLQDGVPLNLADGSADFQAIEPLSARYIEVYRGANTLQYGSTTLGGAINFVSPSGFSAAPFSARVEAGSFGYKRAQMSAGGSSGTTDWFIAGSEFFQKGYRAHARQDTQRFSGNVGWSLTDDLETRFFLQATNSNSELPGALTKSDMNDSPRKADPAAIAGDQHRDIELVRLSNKTTARIDQNQRLELGTFYSYKKLFHPIFQVLQQRSVDYGLSGRFISNATFLSHQNQFIVGTNLLQGALDDDRFRNVAGQPGARTGSAVQRATNYTVFAENQFYLLPSTALVVGAQAVQSKRRLKDNFLTDGDNGIDKTYRHTSPKIGIRHDFGQEIQIYGNVSGSYEPPSFGELSGGPNVTPVIAQRAHTAEIGTRGLWRATSATIRWDVALYRAQLRNELLALNDANGNPLGTTNAAKTLHQGIEAGLEADVGTNWTLRSAYQFNDFRFNDDATYRSNRLAGAPRQFATGELLYKTPTGVYFGPNVRLSSSTYIDHANSFTAAGYGVIGFKLGQQINQSLSWFIDVRNLTGKRHAATTGVIADAQGTDSKQFYPGDGRSAYAGIAFNY